MRTDILATFTIGVSHQSGTSVSTCPDGRHSIVDDAKGNSAAGDISDVRPSNLTVVNFGTDGKTNCTIVSWCSSHDEIQALVWLRVV
jgi:hypothetical protein